MFGGRYVAEQPVVTLTHINAFYAAVRHKNRLMV
jgi:hypothetical protein